MSEVSLLKGLSNYIYTKLPTSRLTQKTALVAISIFAATAAVALYRKPLYIQLQNLKMALFWQAEDYYKIAQSLKINESTTLPNGQTMSCRELLIKAIELDPTHANAYFQLGRLLSTDEKIKVNGTEMTKLDLLEKAHELDPDNTDFKKALAVEYDRLAFIQKDINSAKNLQKIALELDPENAIFCYRLALSLINKETIEINHEKWNQQTLYLKAINLDDTYGDAYSKLASLLDSKIKVMVKGKEMDKLALLRTAVKLAPYAVFRQQALAYELLHLAKLATDAASKEAFSKEANDINELLDSQFKISQEEIGEILKN